MRRWCWGFNALGQLLDGTTEQRGHAGDAPALVDVKGAAAGQRYSCAIVGTERTLKCWGENDAGQLGNGTVATVSGIGDVVGLDGVVSVGAGDQTTCAVTDDGGLFCWGSSRFGRLGNGTAESASHPSPVPVTWPPFAD